LSILHTSIEPTA